MPVGTEIVGIVVVLLFAIDDFQVAGGEILGAHDVNGPISGPEEAQILKSDVAAIVDHVAADSGTMRIVYLSTRVPGGSIRGVGLEVMPQPRVTLHINGAAPHQTGVLDMVKNEKGPERPSSGRHRRPGIIRTPARAKNDGARVHVKLHVTLHEHGAREINAGWKIKHAAAGPGGDIADGLIDVCGIQRLPVLSTW